jgi:hypothetical protein
VALFMDVHNSLPEGATVEDVAKAHAADLKTQEKYGVRYINYWADARGARSSVWSMLPMPRPHTPSTGRPTAWSPTRSIRYRRAKPTAADEGSPSGRPLVSPRVTLWVPERKGPGSSRSDHVDQVHLLHGGPGRRLRQADGRHHPSHRGLNPLLLEAVE